MNTHFPTTQEIIQHFAQYIKVSETLKNELLNRLHYKSFKKGETLHDANKICTESHFIIKGLVRVYFLKDGKEISEYFCAENEWVNSPRSLRQQQIDIYAIDTLEPTETFCLSVKDLVYLLIIFLKWNVTRGYLWEQWQVILWNALPLCDLLLLKNVMNIFAPRIPPFTIAFRLEWWHLIWELPKRL